MKLPWQIANLGLFSVSSSLIYHGFILMNRTLVVVPTYNERENLPPLAQRILALPTAVDLLVVDDNSPDGTGRISDQLASEFSSIHVLYWRRQPGFASPSIAGFTWGLEPGYHLAFAP